MILRAILAGLLFTGSFTITAVSAAAVTPDSTQTVGIEVLDDKLVLVRVMVNGAGPHLFLLDTGGASTVVSDTLARQLGLIAAGSHRIDTMSGARTVGLTRIDELSLGTETFTGVEVLWMHLASLRARDSRIQGVIGQDLLRTRSFILDYEARRLTFNPSPEQVTGVTGLIASAQAGGRPPGGLGHRLPLDWADGRPLVTLTAAHHAGRDTPANTRAELRFVIDSGGTHVILFDHTSDAHPQSLQQSLQQPQSQPLPQSQQQRQPLMNALRRCAKTTMTMTNHGGTRPVMTTTVDRLELSEGKALRDVVTALVPADPEQGRIEDGLLPASLFRAIYFDNRAGEVVLRR